MNTLENLSKALGILECLMLTANTNTANALALAAELIQESIEDVK